MKCCTHVMRQAPAQIEDAVAGRLLQCRRERRHEHFGEVLKHPELLQCLCETEAGNECLGTRKSCAGVTCDEVTQPGRRAVEVVQFEQVNSGKEGH
jgi:hypothetical protein